MNERKGYLLLSLAWLGALLWTLATGTWWLAALGLLCWPWIFDRSRRPHLPVMMFHTINDHYSRFLYSNICVTRRYFRLAMGWLNWRGYRTLTSEEAEAFTRGQDFGRRIVHLTFDDGYLDNWVNAWPILKRNGQRGTVYVSRDFIRTEGEPRPVREGDDQTGLEDWGYMNLAEIRLAHASGVLEFYPHGRTHTWYEHSDTLLGFHLPGDRLAWLDWNRRPEAKPDWIRDFPQGFVPAGWPVLEHRKSLEARRLLVDEALLQHFVDGLADLPQPWTAAGLLERWRAFRSEVPVIGRPETDEEFNARLLDELTSTKVFLEQQLGVECGHFCWPGGGKDPRSLELAYGVAGYRMSTIHQDAVPNRRGVPDRWLYRVGAGNSQNIAITGYNLLRFISFVEIYRRNYCWIGLFAMTELVEKVVSRRRRNRRPDDRHTPFIGIPLPGSSAPF
ncbi:MAG: polysaccharide deacetylase family protein [Candidatus Delongbacteria bacterium]